MFRFSLLRLGTKPRALHEALDEHRIAIITEQERRASLAVIPEQIEQLAKMYRDGGGDEQTLTDALTLEQAARED